MLAQLNTQNETSMGLQIPIKGMTCASCVARVEKAVGKLSEVQSVSVNLATESARIEMKAKKADRLPDVIQAIEKAGYEVPFEELDFRVTGMTCSSCISHVEEFLAEIPGLLESSVNLGTEKAHVKVIKGMVTKEQLKKAIEDAGYEAHFEEGNISSINEEKEKEIQKDKIKLLISTALTLPLVLPMLAEPFGLNWMLPAWIQLLLATPVQFVLGWRFYKAAFKAVRAGSANMDLLVALGTSAAYGLSVFEYWNMHEHIDHMQMNLYFEGSATIITFILLGKFLEARAKQQTSSAIKALQALRPDVARILRGGDVVEVSIESLKVSDVVVVKPGERIPVDGEILQGASQIDESMMTGEPMLISKSIGEKVIGGTINTDGFIHVKTLAVGSETALAKIIRHVESAQAAKAPIQKLVDRVSSVFVPVVIALSLLTIIGWGFANGDWQQAIINGIAVLIIACPCALGLATPTSIMVGTGLGAKAGILIKDAESLEVAHSVTTVAFDKTGTLTEGKPSVTDLIPIGVSSQELLTMAAAVQKGSEHPLAKAVLDKVTDETAPNYEATEIKAIAGYGVEARLPFAKVLFGNKKLMIKNGILLHTFENQLKELESNGKTISFLADAESKTLFGLVAFSDTIKASAYQTVRKLHLMGIKTVMLTGDNEGSAKVVAQKLGIDTVRADILPHEKSQVIEELKANGEIVAMVGDGINDAPALAAAHVGIAMSTGTDVAMHSAGVTLMRGNPLLIPDAIEISRKTYRKIQQNLFWAFVYNVVGIPLAILGFMNPMIAGGAMALSSVSVLGNALVLRRWKPESATVSEVGA